MQTSSTKKARYSGSPSSLLQLPDDALFLIFSLCDVRELFYAIPFLCKSVRQCLKKQFLTNEEIFKLANEERIQLKRYTKLPIQNSTDSHDIAGCPESLEQLMMRYTVTVENKIWKSRVHSAVPSFGNGLATKDHLYCYKKIYIKLFPMKKPVYAAESIVSETLKKIENLPTATMWSIFKQDSEEMYGPDADKKIAQEKEQASTNQIQHPLLFNELSQRLGIGQYFLMQQQQQQFPIPSNSLPLNNHHPMMQLFPPNLGPLPQSQPQQQQQLFPMSQPDLHFIPQAIPQSLPNLPNSAQMQPNEPSPFDMFARPLIAPIPPPFNHVLPAHEALPTEIIEPPPPPKPMDATKRLDKCIELHEQSFVTNIENVAKHLEEVVASLRATKDLVASNKAKQMHKWKKFEPNHGFKILEKIISFLRGTVTVDEIETTDPDPIPERGSCTWSYEAKIQLISPVNSNSVELTVEHNIHGYSDEGGFADLSEESSAVYMKLVDFSGRKLHIGEIANLWPAAFHLGLDTLCSDCVERGILVHEMWNQIVDPVLCPQDSAFEGHDLDGFKGPAPPKCSPSDLDYIVVMEEYRRNCEEMFSLQPGETNPKPTITPPMIQDLRSLNMMNQHHHQQFQDLPPLPQFQPSYPTPFTMQQFNPEMPLQPYQQQQFLMQPMLNHTPLHPSTQSSHPLLGTQQQMQVPNTQGQLFHHTQPQQQQMQFPPPSFYQHR